MKVCRPMGGDEETTPEGLTSMRSRCRGRSGKVIWNGKSTAGVPAVRRIASPSTRCGCDTRLPVHGLRPGRVSREAPGLFRCKRPVARSSSGARIGGFHPPERGSTPLRATRTRDSSWQSDATNVPPGSRRGRGVTAAQRTFNPRGVGSNPSGPTDRSGYGVLADTIPCHGIGEGSIPSSRSDEPQARALFDNSATVQAPMG